ncbi:MAG TPA: hypothetical protein VHL78_03300 [Actinomycetota bacterium]|nr:hypothetical protein [Actinomycetota bacterium]
MASPERVGVLVLRLWRDELGVLRARITTRVDISSSEDARVTAASADGILEAVRAWVEEFADASGGAPTEPR